MRYLIGALFGVVLVLLFLGGTTYYQYYEMERKQNATQEESQLKLQKHPSSYRNSRSPSSRATSRQQTPIKNWSKPSVPKTEPNLYTWKDKNGNKVISSQPPATGSYEKLILPEEGLSVIEMKKTKPKPKAKENKTKRTARYTSSALIKQQLISKNKGKCRWLVGRTFELYSKIQQHSGMSRSIYCDEYMKRMREMYQFSREGNGCYYPYQYRTPAQC